MSTQTSGLTPPLDGSDNVYRELLQVVSDNLASRDASETFFTVDVKAGTGHSLFTHYLGTFPEEDRQHYHCRTCAEWLKRFGQIVDNINGVAVSIAFADREGISEPVRDVLQKLRSVVERQGISGVFPDHLKKMAIDNNGKFSHFQGILTDKYNMAFAVPLHQREGVVNASNEAVRVVTDALNDYSAESVATLVDHFTRGKLHHLKKFAAEATKFAELYTSYHAAKDTRVKTNLVYLALSHQRDLVHFKGSSVGAFLGYIEAGEESVGLLEFKKYTDSVNYQRPTEDPTEMELEAAKKRVVDEGLTPSFDRRYATVDDVNYWFWKAPEEKAVAVEGAEPSIFDGLGTKNPSPNKGPKPLFEGGSISLVNFVDSILPKAVRIGIELSNTAKNNFIQLVTATHEDAPLIIKWDKKARRNPVTQYIYHGGSRINNWTGASSRDIKVLGITTSPEHWEGPVLKLGVPDTSFIFILEDFADKVGNSIALFPEFLGSEYRDIRRVVEAYSQKTPLSPAPEGKAVAAGLALNYVPNSPIQATSGPFRVIVTTETGDRTVYSLINYL